MSKETQDLRKKKLGAPGSGRDKPSSGSDANPTRPAEATAPDVDEEVVLDDQLDNDNDARTVKAQPRSTSPYTRRGNK